MKYSSEIEIDLPRNEVFEKFTNPNNYKHWQKGFISMTPINGTPGTVGAQARLNYKMGKRDLAMIETITRLDAPQEFNATYDAKGVFNIQENYFKEVSGHKTQWISDNEFKFSGFMKLIGLFLPGAFKKQTNQYMSDFKNFVENGVNLHQ